MSAESARIPVKLWLEPQLRTLQQAGDFVTILQAGEPSSGMILLKIRCRGNVTLYTQTRDFNDVLGWSRITPKGQNTETVEETWADAYIARECARDRDLWAVEIDTREPVFPLLGTLFE